MAGYYTDCLYSTVRNISDVAQNFSFLPPHGRTLQPGEEYSMWGDVQNAIKTDFAGSANDRKIKAFLACIAPVSGSAILQIVKNPHPILERTDHVPRQLRLAPNNTLIVDEVCWSSASASA